jgi:uncharacterized protein YpbB
MASSNAKVSSIEALDLFRSSLVVYLDKAGTSLDEVSQEVKRTRHQLHNEKLLFWKMELRKRVKALDLARSEHFSARLTHSGSSGATGKQVAVRRATEAKREAEEKLRLIKKWCREYDSTIEPLAKKVDNLRQSLTYDLPNAVAFLEQAAITLSDYAGMRAAGKPATQPAPEEEENET